jgi:hypothetical protein
LVSLLRKTPNVGPRVSGAGRCGPTDAIAGLAGYLARHEEILIIGERLVIGDRLAA